MRTFDYKWCQAFIDDPAFDAAFEDGSPRWCMEGVIRNFNNVVLKWKDHGIFVLIETEEGLYEVHTLFKDTSEFLEAADEGYAYMFCVTDCVALYTTIPEFNRPAKIAAKRAGFEHIGYSNESFTHEGVTYPIETWYVTLEQWALRSKTNRRLGEGFHEQLHDAMGYENHPPHKENDAMSGFVRRCLQLGNVDKIFYYNSWAEKADFFPLTLLNYDPPVIYTGDATILIQNDTLEII